jgi:hypothetical protein
MSHVGAEKTGKAIEVFIAVGVPDIAALAAINHRVI